MMLRCTWSVPPPIELTYAANAERLTSAGIGWSAPSSTDSAPSSSLVTRTPECTMRDIANLPSDASGDAAPGPASARARCAFQALTCS